MFHFMKKEKTEEEKAEKERKKSEKREKKEKKNSKRDKLSKDELQRLEEVRKSLKIKVRVSKHVVIQANMIIHKRDRKETKTKRFPPESQQTTETPQTEPL